MFLGCLLCSALAGCGGGGGGSPPFSPSNPITITAPTCDTPDSGFFWFINGFTKEQLADPDAGGDDLVVLLRIGDTATLTVASGNTFSVDCTAHVTSATWVNTSSVVADLAPNGGVQTLLTARAVGDTNIFVDLQFGNGRVIRAEPFLIGKTDSGRPTVRVVSP
jgi:hypothetical protein